MTNCFDISAESLFRLRSPFYQREKCKIKNFVFDHSNIHTRVHKVSRYLRCLALHWHMTVSFWSYVLIFTLGLIFEESKHGYKTLPCYMYLMFYYYVCCPILLTLHDHDKLVFWFYRFQRISDLISWYKPINISTQRSWS